MLGLVTAYSSVLTDLLFSAHLLSSSPLSLDGGIIFVHSIFTLSVSLNLLFIKCLLSVLYIDLNLFYLSAQLVDCF